MSRGQSEPADWGVTYLAHWSNSMTKSQVHLDHPDMVSRQIVGQLAREIIDEYLNESRIDRIEKIKGVQKLCSLLGVEIPSGSV